MSPARFAPLACLLLVASSSTESSSAPPQNDTGATEAARTTESGTTDASNEAGAEAATDAAGPQFSEKLSEMGLFADIAKGTIAADVREFKPTHELWSDA